MDKSETMTKEYVPKVEKIIIFYSDPNNPRDWCRPYGFYHIIKCYDEEREDKISVAYLWPLEFSEDDVINIASKLAKKHNCELDNLITITISSEGIIEKK